MRLLVDGTAPSFASSGSRNVNRQPERHSRSRVRLALLRRWCLNWDLPSTTAFSPRNASHSEHHLANEASQRAASSASSTFSSSFAMEYSSAPAWRFGLAVVH